MRRGGSRYLRIVGRTAAFNASTTLVSAATGVLLARVLGAAGRGDYAAATAFFGIVLVIFELGLAASVVYFSARRQDLADTFVRTALGLLLPLAVAGSVFVVVASFTFMDGSEGRDIALLVIAALVPISFAAAPAVFALQALDIRLWNVVRLVQPLLFASALTAAVVTLDVDVRIATGVFGASLAAQGLLAWWLYHRRRERRGRFSPLEAAPMLRYGLSNAASTAPNALNGRFDQILLALMVAPAALGQYAVAVSLSLMVAPLAVAFGNVAFPRLAGGDDSEATLRHALRGSFVVAILGVVVVVALAPVIVPTLYGQGFDEVPRLLLGLAPGAAFFVVNQVVGDLLRGMGRPTLVARCEWTGVVVTIVGLAILVPLIGAFGAALTSSATYITVHVLLQFALRAARSKPNSSAATGAVSD
ncbi:oligosaccharide flippase family protein [Blastococcus sp. BMG 814]|uniref:Oligosaccharide flippase family protein n=1 Tax=Blastococcus carthaginiensis TaxID=3050034 RepID=A0ABT9IE31_9ACTN|nr:oligosaccharide flippase family protein [Blastococcus carthaginiensis]MDP5183838.1 oligosaccharide flippase family protein [Blastococcus carthaginiensis]